MENFLQTLQAVPGLGPIIVIAGIVMMAMDINKLYGVATMPRDKKNKPDLRFYYILPGLFLFALGYQILVA